MHIKKDTKEKGLLLIFLLLVLIFTRLYALFSVGALFHHFEGLWRGWMAKELLDGAGWGRIFNNPYFPAEGGSVVTGYIAALFFAIFGDSFFSLALVPILFSLLILTSFYLFLDRYFNRRTAIIFSFLFIFSPLEFFRFSLLALGYHFESVLFSILGLFCFFEIFFNEVNYKIYLEKRPYSNTKKLYLLFIAFGLISGLGVYFYYTYLIMLFTIILFWFILDKRFFLKRYFSLFLLGLIIGFIPWLIYNITHNFQGLNIHSLTLFEIIFSKSIPQIFQTLGYILIYALPKYLGRNFYLTIVFSFILIAFLNLNSFKQILKNLFSPQIKYFHNTKELIFIAYVLVFISTWSILYMPISAEETPWLSGLWGRLFHIYPFLFILVAFCFNRFLIIKKKFLGTVFSSAFAILILSIGFSNYSEVVSTPRVKIDPLKIKGYSVQLAFARDQKNIVSPFLDRDMARICAATNYDGRLCQFFTDDLCSYSIYADNRFLQELANDPQLDEAQKVYYYLQVGLNSGDLTEGYDILNLKKLIAQKVPPRYRHYLYEGIAISLMNRRPKELIENLDFIDKVPLEYRHYFWFELGRVIGEHFDGKEREEKLQYAMKKFSSVSEDYLYRGLIGGLIDDNYLEGSKRYYIKEKYRPYFYRTITRNIFSGLPSQDEISHRLKEIGADEKYERYFYYGMIEAFFKNSNIYCEEEIKKGIKELTEVSWMSKEPLYEGLGLSLGHLTFGHINRFTGFIESLLNDEELSHFYYGYRFSLKERYGEDLRRITELIDYNVPEGFKMNVL